MYFKDMLLHHNIFTAQSHCEINTHLTISLFSKAKFMDKV